MCIILFRWGWFILLKIELDILEEFDKPGVLVFLWEKLLARVIFRRRAWHSRGQIQVQTNWLLFLSGILKCIDFTFLLNMATAPCFLHFDVWAIRHRTSIEEVNKLWLLKITLRWRRLLQLFWILYTSWSWSAIGLLFFLTSWASPALCIFRASALFPKLWNLWLHLKLLGHGVPSHHSLRANWILGHRTLSAFGDSTSLGSVSICWNHQIVKLILGVIIMLTTLPIWIHSSHSSIFDLLML